MQATTRIKLKNIMKEATCKNYVLYNSIYMKDPEKENI